MRKEDVLRMIDAIHRERGVEREVLFVALEEALSMATRKKLNVEEGLEFAINRQTGEIHVATPSGSGQVPSPGELGRIAAQVAKQVFMQKIREAERDKVYAAFVGQVGTIQPAVVHKVENASVILHLGGKTEAILPRSERIQSERLHVGDRVRVLIKEVRSEGSRVKIIVSRKDDEFVKKLFELEIPEISEGVVHVMRVARDAGYRCKVAIYSGAERVDAVGACLGVRGTRIRAINDELGMEKVDIVEWSDSLEELVQNALKPARDIPLEQIFPDEEAHSVFVLVDEEQKPLAIGVGGRNVRLASRICGWDIEIKTPAEYEAELMAAQGDAPPESSEPPNEEPPAEEAPTPEEAEPSPEAAEPESNPEVAEEQA